MNKKLLLLGLIPTLLLTGCNTTPDNGDKKITLSRETLSLAIDDTFQIEAKCTGFEESEISSLTWTSRDENIATVNDGLIYGVSEGSTTITAAINKVAASLSVSVYSTGEVATFSAMSNQEVYVGQSLSFNETTTYKGQIVDATYTYETSNSNVVSVNGSEVTATGEGEAVVTITSKYLGFTNKATCTVTVVPCIEVVLEQEYAKLAPAAYKGTAYLKEIQLSAKAYVNNEPVTNQITWSSSDTNVATVTSNGLVTSNKEGSAEIYATIKHNNENYSKTAVIVVETPKIYLDEIVVVNMLNNEKYLDLEQYGINVAIIDNVQMKEGNEWTNVSFEIKGNKVVIPVSNSLYNQTREMLVSIQGELTIFTVEFKDYVKDKVFFADSESHLTDLEALGDVTISYDATRSITANDVKNADKENYVNESTGSIKVQLTGKNADEVVLKHPSMTNLDKYDYMVFYVYSNYDGYFGCVRHTDGIEIKANQWNRVAIRDFSKVLKANGKTLAEDKYNPSELVLRFYNNRQPSKKAIMWVSSIYAGISPVNRILSMEVGSTPTYWWVNGVKLTSTSGYDDYYGHFTNEKPINLDDIREDERQYFKHEENGTMVITHGTKNIEAHYFNEHPLQGYTDLVFYVYTDDPNAASMNVYTRQNVTVTQSLVQGHWTRVHMDLDGLRVLNDDGDVHTIIDNLNGFFIGIGASSAAEGAKFYITSIFGFNW